MNPFTLVNRAVFPIHFSIAVSLVILVDTLVEVTAFPGELAHAIFLVIYVAALVHITMLVVASLLPLSIAVLEAVFELSNVDTAILPFVLALALGFAHHVRPREAVAIGEDIRSLAVFQAILPLALVPVPVLPHVDAVARGL